MMWGGLKTRPTKLMLSFKQLLNQWGWMILVIGGILWAGFHAWYILTESSSDPETLIPILWILGLAAIFLLLGVFTFYSRSRGGGGGIGLVITLIGMALFAFGTIITSTGSNSAWLLAIIGEMITSIGLLIFGVANFRERLLGPLYWLPLILAPIYILGWAFDPGSAAIPLDNWTEWLAVVYGLGWILIGLGDYIESNKLKEK
jgi:hypothetical protein